MEIKLTQSKPNYKTCISSKNNKYTKLRLKKERK